MAERLHPIQVEQVGPTGIYPVSGPLPPGNAEVRGQGELAHPEERVEIRRIAHQQTEQHAALLVGRALLGGFFIFSGLHHFMDGATMRGYMRAKGVRFPAAVVAGSGAMLMLGGLSLLTGVRPKVGASLISTFLVGATPLMHDFWNAENEEKRSQAMADFTKNMALLGGAVLAAAVPEPWPASVHLRRANLLAEERTTA